FATGFAWYFLGHAQHAFLAVAQIADLGGAYAVSFLVAAVNAALFEMLYSSRRMRAAFSLSESSLSTAGRTRLVACGLVALFFGASLAYGSWRLSQDAFDTGPRVALIQGNLDQRIRNAVADPDQRDQAGTSVARHYLD